MRTPTDELRSTEEPGSETSGMVEAVLAVIVLALVVLRMGWF
jgi:hypothetical protein